MNIDEIKLILENHKHWIDEDCEGWENMCADLRGADLRGADLRGADLRGADLYSANLYSADLRGANLYSANLYSADLRGADLRGADLYSANLRDANLRDANLRDANLRDANLRGADLYSANLYSANLRGAENIPFIPMVCPDTGSFIGWKKAKNYIVKLEIPEDAKRSSATGRKCRCDKARILEIQNPDGTKANVDSVPSDYDITFIYSVGSVVKVNNFCEDRFNECAAGIHFFINRQEAVDY